jgi:hypothetical protein
MITAAEHRAWAEESLEWAGEATTPEERDAHIRSAEIWVQSALRSECLSKQPPTTEYEWVLQQAEAQNDPKVKQQFLELAPRWLLLARGYVVNKSSDDPAQIAKNNSYPDRDVAI